MNDVGAAAAGYVAAETRRRSPSRAVRNAQARADVVQGNRDTLNAQREQQIAQLRAALKDAQDHGANVGQVAKELLIPGSVTEAAIDLVVGKYLKLGKLGFKALKSGGSWLLRKVGLKAS